MPTLLIAAGGAAVLSAWRAEGNSGRWLPRGLCTWRFAMDDTKWIPALLIASLLMVAGAIATWLLDKTDWTLILTGLAAVIAVACLVRLLTSRPAQND